MKNAKIYKFNRKKYSVDSDVNLKKPFVIEVDGEILKSESGKILRYDTIDSAENSLITIVNKNLKQIFSKKEENKA